MAIPKLIVVGPGGGCPFAREPLARPYPDGGPGLPEGPAASG
jgi:hypothetical protein